jgi:hypothetical protein
MSMFESAAKLIINNNKIVTTLRSSAMFYICSNDWYCYVYCKKHILKSKLQKSK